MKVLCPNQHPSIKATSIHDDLTLIGPPDDRVPAYLTMATLTQD